MKRSRLGLVALAVACIALSSCSSNEPAGTGTGSSSSDLPMVSQEEFQTALTLASKPVISPQEGEAVLSVLTSDEGINPSVGQVTQEMTLNADGSMEASGKQVVNENAVPKVVGLACPKREECYYSEDGGSTWLRAGGAEDRFKSNPELEVIRNHVHPPGSTPSASVSSPVMPPDLSSAAATATYAEYRMDGEGRFEYYVPQTGYRMTYEVMTGDSEMFAVMRTAYENDNVRFTTTYATTEPVIVERPTNIVEGTVPTVRRSVDPSAMPSPSVTK